MVGEAPPCEPSVLVLKKDARRMSKSRLPNFLIIGAQKCATSTLSNDLNAHPNIYIPPCKEVGALTRASVLSANGRRAYARYYTQALDFQICGDASTAYSKKPDFPMVATRARQVLGSDVKIIYIVRDPVDRVLSHYKHMYSIGYAPADIREAISSCSWLVNYSRYAMQLNYWLAEFDPTNIRVVHYETYIKNREQILNELITFLLPNSSSFSSNNLGETQNRAEERRVVGPLLSKFLLSDLYKAYLRPTIPNCSACCSQISCES